MIKRITIIPEGIGYRARLLCEVKSKEFLFNAHASGIEDCLSKVMYKYQNALWKNCCKLS